MKVMPAQQGDAQQDDTEDIPQDDDPTDGYIPDRFDGDWDREG